VENDEVKRRRTQMVTSNVLATEEALSDRSTLVAATRCQVRDSTTPTSPWSPAARSVVVLNVEVAPGRGSRTPDEATITPGSRAGLAGRGDAEGHGLGRGTS
jgi:hypothetical protein